MADPLPLRDQLRLLMGPPDEQTRQMMPPSPYDVPQANENEALSNGLQTIGDKLSAKGRALIDALRGPARTVPRLGGEISYETPDLTQEPHPFRNIGTTARSLAQNLVASVPAGLSGLIHGLGGVEQHHSGQGFWDEAGPAVDRAMEKLGYTPPTAEGRNALKDMTRPMKAAGDLLHQPAELASMMGAPPFVGGTLATLADVGVPEAGEEAALARQAARAARRESLAPALAEALRATREGGGSMNKARAKARAEVTGVRWQDMTPEEAEAAALAGKHLKLDPTTGEVIGGPPGVTTLDEVDAARDHALQRSREGAHGMDWYDRQQAMLHQLAPGREDALAKAIATYSPQAQPGTNMGWTISNWNKLLMDEPSSTLTLEGAPKTRKQAQTFLDTVGRGGGADLIPGGEKVGAFVNDLQLGPGAKPTNDLHTGRVLSIYPESDSRGLKPWEHSYASGETSMLTKELADEGTRGPLGQEFTQPRQGQAAMWTGNKLATELERPEYGGRPFEALSPELKQQALRRSAGGYDTEIPQFTAAMTRELIPARVSGHMEGLLDLPYSEKLRFTREAEPFSRDPLAASSGALSLPTGHGLGEFTNALGETEYNPNLTTRILASFEKGGGKGVENAGTRLMDALATYHGATDVQAGVPWHTVKESGVPKGQKNAAHLRYLDPGSHPMAPESMGIGNVRTIALRDQLKAKGLNLLDTGDGTFTIAGPDFGDSKAAQLRKGLKDVNLDVPGLETELKPGNYRGNYIDLQKEWAAPQGEGHVTQRVVDALGKEPVLLDRLQSRRGIEAARLHGLNAAEDAAIARGVKGAPRADVRSLRSVLMEKGPKGLVEMTKGWTKADWVKSGLPVVAGMVFADQARRNDGG